MWNSYLKICYISVFPQTKHLIPFKQLFISKIMGFHSFEDTKKIIDVSDEHFVTILSLYDFKNYSIKLQ
jgi:hypothetical protein